MEKEVDDFNILIKRLIKGAKNVLFRKVIKASTGYSIIKVSGIYFTIIKDFKIVDLYNLRVDLKPEFNANNPMIYENCEQL